MSVPAEQSWQEANPYASPLAAGEVAQQFPAELWRFGELVVAHRQAVWPRICVKTGEACNNSLKVPIATQYPNWLLLPLFGLPWIAGVISLALPKSTIGLSIGLGILAALAAGFVVALIFLIRMAKRTKIEFFVSQEYMAQRRAKLRIANALTVLGILGLIVSLLLLMPLGALRWGFFLVSVIVITAGGSYRAHWLLILKPTKTKPEYIVLRGAGQPFLMQLPHWPYGPL